MYIYKETEIIDMRAVADIILNLSIELSKKINEQLLEPISAWIDDPDFMKRHSVILENKIDWKTYKRKQRQWTRQQKLMAAERLKSYWRDIRSRKNIRKEMGQVLGCTNFRENVTLESFSMLNDDVLSFLLKPFSPVEQAKRETEQQFCFAEKLSPSEFLPWGIILRQQIKNKMNFDDLPQYLPDKTEDRTAKFINLLYLESDGHIKIYQYEPFGQVSIQPKTIDAEPEGSFIIKDRGGSESTIDWGSISDAQRDKVIADSLNKKILCKAI